MAENSQLSGKTKNNSTGTSSTDASSAVIGNHENAVVPHKISNHDKLVQTMVMVDGEWINVNDTNDQANMKEDMHKVNKKVVEAQKGIVEAKNTADSAVKYADSAVSASKVNSDAIVAQSSAVIEVKSAMDSATAEIQQLKANAASDVAQIRVDVAQVQNEVDTAKAANSASVDKLKIDIGLAQKDLDNVRDSLTKAQSAVEQNQKLINDSVAKINNDIAQNRQDIVTAQQANDDLAKQLDTYSKEAQEQGKTIKTIQDNQDGFSITIADVKGNVTKVSDTVDGLSAGLKDAQGNIASAKAQADQLNATLTDHSKNIAQLTATAKELSSTLEDADGRLSKVEQTASEQSTTLSDLQGNLTQVKQTADSLVTTLKDAQGNIEQIKQDAKGTLEQLSNAEGDITALQKDVSGIKLTIADHDKNIHTLQTDSKTLKDDMADAKGNISSLQKISTSLVSEFRDHDGRLSKVEQTATEHTSELADTKGNLDKVTQKANTLQLLLSDAQKNIQNIQLDAKGLHDTLTGQNNQLANLYVTLNSFDSEYSDITGDLQSKQTALSTEQQQTKDQLLQKADKSVVDQANNLISQLSAEQKTIAGQISQKVSSSEYQTLKDKVNRMKVGTRNLLHDTSDQYRTLTGDGWMEVHTSSDEYTSVASYHNGNLFTYAATISNTSDVPVELQVWRCDQNKNRLTNGMLGMSAYVYPGQKDVRVFLTGSIDNNTWYLQSAVYSSGGQSGQHTIQVKDERLVEGNVEGTWEANPTDTIASIQKNTTAIDENSKAIKLKADATEVNNLKGTVNSHSASINLFSDQLKNMVTESKVNDIINEKGFTTQNTVQSIVNQKAGQLSESITQLDTTFKTGMENSVQLVRKSDFEDGSKGGWTVKAVVSATNPAPPAELGPSGMKVLQTNVRDAYENDIWYSVKPGEKFDVDFWFKPSASYNSNFGLFFADKNKDNPNWIGVYVNKSNQWKHYTGTITAPINASFAKPWLQMDKDASNTTDTALLAKPSIRRQNATTVAAIQQVTASIDGLQSNVANKADKSQITQLSNVIQSKVNSSDYNSKVSQLSTDINARVTKGDLLSQINVEAGRTLIQSNKIYFDADSFVMSPNSKAFIPSAYITNINADKITTGTLDAAKFNVKNFSADNIVGGTLSGVVVKTGANDRYFQTSKDNIYWVRKGSMSLVGNDTYLNSANGLNIADENNIQLTTWGGATVNKDGSITNNSGNSGHPKIVIDDEGKYNPDDIYGSAFGGGPGNSEIAQWVGNKEYTVLTRGKGLTVRLNDENKNSVFAIQKDNKLGFYVGGGDDGNVINVTTTGTGNHIAFSTNSFDIDGEVNIKNNHGLTAKNVHVTGWLGVDGSKNSIVRTSQGTVAINAYETAEYYFGDIGEGQTGADGIAYIGIEKLFNETVNTTIPYQVFLTAYGSGNLWVAQREHDRFMVKSDQPNIKFGWEIKAKRKGYEHTRLQNVDNKLNNMEATS